MAHIDEKPESTGPATGQQPRWVNQWTIYALAGATAIALILAVTGWNRAGTYQDEANGLRGQVNDLNGQVNGLQSQVATVSAERDALKPLEARVASLGQEIDSFGVERSQMLNDRNGVVQRLGAVTWAEQAPGRAARRAE